MWQRWLLVTHVLFFLGYHLDIFPGLPYSLVGHMTEFWLMECEQKECVPPSSLDPKNLPTFLIYQQS